jgi:thioesterase domain-containing protein
VPIQPVGEKTPLFLVHGAGGDVLWGYANLAAHLGKDQPVYGIKSHGQDGREEPMELEEMARSYVEAIRSQQAHGPYFLGGYCFGGNVAYEMARQLRMQGEQVDLVLLIDTAPANAGYEEVPWYRPDFMVRFARNLKYWLGDFAALKPEERRSFMGRKLRALGRKLKSSIGLRRGPQPFDLEEVIDTSHFPANELKLWQAHLEALLAHVERPYAGRVALLRTRGQALFCSLAEDLCWGKLVRTGLTVRCIPGSHENIFMEPHVRVLASEICNLLESTRPSEKKPTTPQKSAPTESVTHL